jgi:hypothetical protein
MFSANLYDPDRLRCKQNNTNNMEYYNIRNRDMGRNDVWDMSRDDVWDMSSDDVWDLGSNDACTFLTTFTFI